MPHEAAPPAHPSQKPIWIALDKVEIRKVWAAHLDVDVSELSRWATGARAMSHDDMLAALRIAVRCGHRATAERIVRALAADYDEAIGAAREPADADPFRAVFEAARAGSGAVAAIEQSLADDGKIAGKADAERLLRAADEMEHAAASLRAMARGAMPSVRAVR